MAAGAIRHSLAANNGVANLFSNNFRPVLLIGADACVLNRLTLLNRADTEKYTKFKKTFSTNNYLFNSECYVTLAHSVSRDISNSKYGDRIWITFGTALGTKHHCECHFDLRLFFFDALIPRTKPIKTNYSFRYGIQNFRIQFFCCSRAGRCDWAHAKRQLDRK